MIDTMMGIIRGGRVELDGPALLPDGTRVRVEPRLEEEGGFLAEEDWPTTPGGIAAHALKMSNFEPVILTIADRARIAVARTAWRESELAAVRKEMGLDS